MTNKKGTDSESPIEEGILDKALAWQAILRGENADWDGYIAWLEADPRHRIAFNTLALTEAAVDEHKDALKALLDMQSADIVPRARRKFPLFLGGGIAAALALAIALPTVRTPSAEMRYAAGQQASRTVTLPNGVNVTLSPSSYIVVDGRDAGRIKIASGEAYFDVRHDPGRLLTIEAGPYQISDIGTRFSVNLSKEHFRVGVSEGEITVSSERRSGQIRLQAGQQLLGGHKDNLVLSAIPPESVGSWRDGRLFYADAPLPLVAADISRYSGKKITIAPSLEMKHFSGTLVTGDGSKLLPDLASILAVPLHDEKDGTVRIGGAAH